MRGLVKTQPGPGRLALLEVPEPAPAPGEIKLRVAAAGICGTDVHIQRGEWPVPAPLILGHEIAGVVTETGAGVIGFAAGDRVTLETDAYLCGECVYCRSGDEHLCPARKAIGTTRDGGFADYLTIRAASAHQLPPAVSLEAGALAEPLAVAVHTVVERGCVQPGELVLVIGPGTIGLLAAQVAQAAGARVVVAGLSRHGERFRLARRLGLAETLVLDAPGSADRVRTLGGDLGADLAVECSGAGDALHQALTLVRKGGRVAAVGFAGTPAIDLDLNLLINKEITLIGARGKRHSCWPIALRLLAAGQVDTAALITHRFALEAWDAAFATAAQPGTKVLFTMTPL